jgi:hypothetical protein
MADKADPSGGIDHSEEGRRLAAADNGAEPWRAWGPYLAERGWGTVREDYSSDGSAWNFFPHDHARSRVYRWNEDGMAGFCDELQNDDGRYWVVTVDYAKAGPHDLLMRLTVENAGPDEAMLHVLPTLWFRNTWAWGPTDHGKPVLREHEGRVVGQHD